MEIWACISQKGGAGKSTLAINLAVEASKRGRKVLLVDLDPQGNALQWAQRRTEPNPDVTAESVAALDRVIRAARSESYGLVVLDTAPNADSAALRAAKAARFVLIPCRPSQFDLEAIATTLDLCDVARRPAMVVFNAASPRGQSEVDEASAAVADRGGLVCPIVIRQRVAFRRSTPGGNSASEYEPGGKAAAEIVALYDETRRRARRQRGELEADQP